MGEGTKKSKEGPIVYLPDTNIFILGLRGQEPEASFLKKAILNNKLFISVIVIGEFLSKVEDQEAEAFNKLINTYEVLLIDEEAARIAADYRKESFKLKRALLLDCFLAAQAKLNHLTLVTNNKSDFPMKDIKVISP